ncbi:uncharacterized protein METZ01_LOCUS340874 [marine metagenome]|uniref:Uncharacterized protein n=1 Tax=marine metagenome TaxID=408172 RepID=A0A382QSZ0_9ZZZZ
MVGASAAPHIVAQDLDPEKEHI